jgi:hypothetical protein
MKIGENTFTITFKRSGNRYLTEKISDGSYKMIDVIVTGKKDLLLRKGYYIEGDNGYTVGRLTDEDIGILALNAL